MPVVTRVLPGRGAGKGVRFRPSWKTALIPVQAAKRKVTLPMDMLTDLGQWPGQRGAAIVRAMRNSDCTTTHVRPAEIAAASVVDDGSRLMELSAEPLAAPSRTRSATVPAFGKDTVDEFMANRASPVRPRRSARCRGAELPDDFLGPRLVLVIEDPQFGIHLSDGHRAGGAGRIEIADLGPDPFTLQDGLEMADDSEVDVVENELHG